jgi:hypothetical protein
MVVDIVDKTRKLDSAQNIINVVTRVE